MTGRTGGSGESKARFIRLPVAAAIELDSLVGALAMVELADRAKWIPDPNQPEPWGEAMRALCALIKLAGLTKKESAVALSDRMWQLQESALEPAR